MQAEIAEVASRSLDLLLAKFLKAGISDEGIQPVLGCLPRGGTAGRTTQDRFWREWLGEWLGERLGETEGGILLLIRAASARSGPT